jgi:PPM family protein phosphatase
MRTVNALWSAGLTDPGLQRSVNEDRFHHDASRGIFLVIDGIGGQAAGGKAADVALATMRDRLERETGSVKDRLREAITAANNEICRLAASRPEWNGMACVLTAAVVDHGRATIGHVGDTRLYKLRGHRIEKITRDHSPVGEREDSNELTELQAMRHPRRNEVYRDVGSEIHRPSDADFADIEEIPFEADAALLLCSDGLTDLVPSATIADVVRKHAGMPETVVRSLVELANVAGGKDNITVLYVEGETFASSQTANRHSSTGSDGTGQASSPGSSKRLVVLLSVLFLVGGFALGLLFRPDVVADLVPAAESSQPGSLVVRQGESIAAAIHRASPGTAVTVEPGEYLERIVLKEGVRLISKVPRGATIRLPVSGSDAESGPAVVLAGAGAELRGFRIVGDAATPLAVGIGTAGAGASVLDVEVTGASTAGVEFAEGSSTTLMGSDIHDNPGPAMIIRARANLRALNNVFSRNGMSERAPGNFVIEAGSVPVFRGNVFVGLSPEAFTTLEEAGRTALKTLNWFPQGRK